MRITIDLHLSNEYQKSSRGGIFEVRSEEEIPKVAHNWVRQVRRETSHHSIIDKIIVDGNNDLTDKDKVKEIYSAPLADWPLNWKSPSRERLFLNQLPQLKDCVVHFEKAIY